MRVSIKFEHFLIGWLGVEFGRFQRGLGRFLTERLCMPRFVSLRILFDLQRSRCQDVTEHVLFLNESQTLLDKLNQLCIVDCDRPKTLF